jgi:hypothetical protein
MIVLVTFFVRTEYEICQLWNKGVGGFESEVIDLVNVERAAEGLPPLSYDASLASAAGDHSEDMGLQNYFNQTGLDGRSACDRITDAGYNWNYCGENIAAGSDQSVIEGATVTLDGSQSSDPNDAIVTYQWAQTDGPAIAISDENAVRPTFVAAPITADATVVFQLTVTDSGGDSDSDTVEINITENGIQSFPVYFIALETTTLSVLGLKPDNNSHLVSLQSIDPESDDIAHRDGMPQNMIYGLVDFKIKVAIPGSSATVTVLLPEPMPQGYRWYKYSQSQGWSDYSTNVSLNGDRTQLSITLVDGGTGDDDGQQNGIIVDPSAMGSALNVSGSSGSGGGGGCFIDTLSNHFMPFFF